MSNINKADRRSTNTQALKKNAMVIMAAAWLFHACNQKIETPTMKYSIIEQWDNVRKIIKDKRWIEISNADNDTIVQQVIAYNQLDKDGNIKPWDTLWIPNHLINKVNNLSEQEPKTDDLWWKDPEQENIQHWYSKITKKTFSTSNDYLVKKLYNDNNVRNRIEKLLNDWYAILIPKETETKDSKIINLQQTIKPKNIISNTLKGKTITLDPWHGWMDVWAIGIAQYGDSNNKEKVVVYESAVVMDIVYRIAQGLQEHGAQVNLTHFYSTRGISTQKDLPPAQRFFQKWEESYQDIRTTTHNNNSSQKWEVIKAKMLKKRSQIANTNNSNLFISFHADIIVWSWWKIDEQSKIMSIKVWEWKTQSKDIAQSLLENWFWYYYNNTKSSVVKHDVANQNLGVLKDLQSPGLLVELWNMANTDQAYYFRTPDNRQKIADSFVKALVKNYQ